MTIYLFIYFRVFYRKRDSPVICRYGPGTAPLLPFSSRYPTVTKCTWNTSQYLTFHQSRLDVLIYDTLSVLPPRVLYSIRAPAETWPDLFQIFLYIQWKYTWIMAATAFMVYRKKGWVMFYRYLWLVTLIAPKKAKKSFQNILCSR